MGKLSIGTYAGYSVKYRRRQILPLLEYERNTADSKGDSININELVRHVWPCLCVGVTAQDGITSVVQWKNGMERVTKLTL